MKIVVYTLGCKVNQYESDSLVRALVAQRHEVSTKLEPADVYILNSCAVTAASEQKSRQTIAKFKKLNPKAKVIVTGCASQNNAKQFEDKKEVTLTMGVAGKHLIPNLLDEIGNLTKELPTEYEDEFEVIPTRTRATLKVQDGCNNYCSYCLIPYLRGASRSRDLNSIIKEAKTLAEFTNEIIVTGINTSDYKIDGKLALGKLMQKLSEIDARIRISSLEVNVITEEFLSVLKEMPNFAPHFHLSLQSGSTEVLKLMNRKYTANEYLEKVKLIRSYFKNASITTDLIVGFSGETDKLFNETIKTLKRANFFDMHVFPYSKRKGTAAYNLPVPDKETVKKRLNKVRKLKAKQFKRYIKQNKGKTLSLLVEQQYKEYTVGHTGNFIKVYVEDKSLKENEFVNIKIIKPFKDGALGKLV